MVVPRNADVDPRDPHPVARPTFVVSTGCMKGGTTWLYDYLAASPDAAPGFRKEYHVFDALDRPDLAWMRGRILEQSREALAALERGDSADADVLQLASMMADPDRYFDYFEGLLAHRAARFTLDMTPNYGLLTRERLAGIRDGFTQRDIRTVTVLLLRDPVERVWSHIRMQKRRRPQSNPGTAEELVLARFQEPQYADRGRFDRTLEAVEAVFEADDRYVGFYEELFDHAELTRICSMIGVEAHPADLENRLNSSPKSGSLSDSTAAQVARSLEPAYVAVAERFGAERVRALWPSARFVL